MVNAAHGLFAGSVLATDGPIWSCMGGRRPGQRCRPGRGDDRSPTYPPRDPASGHEPGPSAFRETDPRQGLAGWGSRRGLDDWVPVMPASLIDDGPELGSALEDLGSRRSRIEPERIPAVVAVARTSIPPVPQDIGGRARSGLRGIPLDQGLHPPPAVVVAMLKRGRAGRGHGGRIRARAERGLLGAGGSIRDPTSCPQMPTVLAGHIERPA